MSWYDRIYQSVKSSGQKSNYQYNIIENTPILHGPETLKTMYRNGNKEQKAAVYKHICNHGVYDDEGYADITKSMWDDFS